MKLVTFEQNGNIFPGVMKGDYIIKLASFVSLRDLNFSCHKCLLPLIEASDERRLGLLRDELGSISDETLKKLAGDGQAFPAGSVKLRAPILRPPAVFCLGFNFRSHAPELKRPVPEVPVIFMKPSKAVVGPDDNIVLPKVATRVDYEVELTVVVGKGGKKIPKADAYSHVFGYTVLNDITARDIQQRDFALMRPWLRSKGFDSFAPIGPCITTSDELTNPMDLELKLTVNGEQRQKSRTTDMVFDIPSVIEYISSFTTLEPGAIIALGTPEKIGQLHDGDVVEATVEGIGTLRNRAVLE
jgi:2-keto-4-pentenoate hydratase/2-oxohepta-3-ene-1,7-dioic acid hydratase in catechol pathway